VARVAATAARAVMVAPADPVVSEQPEGMVAMAAPASNSQALPRSRIQGRSLAATVVSVVLAERGALVAKAATAEAVGLAASVQARPAAPGALGARAAPAAAPEAAGRAELGARAVSALLSATAVS
jgi:hypothetical protein